MRSDGPPYGGATVWLTDGEIRGSDALAAARAAYRGATVPLGFNGIGLEDGHRLGTRAELAVAKLLHIYPQIGVDDARDIPDWDLALHDGRTIEVKFRRPYGGEFALNNNRPTSFKTDFGILVWPGQEDSLVVVGYMTRGDFARWSYEKNLGRGWRLVYPNDRLRPISDIQYIARSRHMDTEVEQGELLAA